MSTSAIVLAFGDEPWLSECLEAVDSQADDALALENVNLQFIPSGARQFLVKTSARFPGADAFSVEGPLGYAQGASQMAYPGSSAGIRVPGRPLTPA